MAHTLDRKGQTGVLVNWPNDGDPGDGPLDDITADVSARQALVIDIGRDIERVFGRPRANTAGWLLVNKDRAYSSNYVGSPLRGDLQPGRRVWVTKTLGDDTITMADPVATMSDAQVLMSGQSSVRLFTGNTRQPRELYGPGPRKRWVEMSAVGALAKLQAADDVSIDVQTDITTGAAALLVLQAAGLSSDEYRVDQEMIDNGRLLSWWYADRRRPMEALIELWASEGPTGAFYEDQYGVAVMEGNTYLFLSDRSNTPQATYVASSAAGDLAIVGIEPIPSYEQIVNTVTFVLEQRAAQSTTQVAEHDGSFALTAAEARTIFFRSTDPLVAHTTPALTTDYTVTGTALASVTSTALGPNTVAVTFTAGAGAATVGPPAGGNGPQLRGDPLTLVGSLDVPQTVDGSDSVTEFGVRALPSSFPRPWPGLHPTEAAAVADAWVLGYQQNRPAFRVTLTNRNGLTMLDVLQRRVSDLIEVSDPDESGFQGHLTIQNIHHEILGDHDHRAVFGCELRFDTDWGRFDEALYDVSRYGQ